MAAVLPYLVVASPGFGTWTGGSWPTANSDLARLRPDDPILVRPWFLKDPLVFRPIVDAADSCVRYIATASGVSPHRLQHIVDLALHAAAALAAFAFLRALHVADVAAALGASLFAALAIHAEAVASGLGRSEIIGSLALFLFCGIAARASERGAARRERRLLPPLVGSAVLSLGLLASPFPLLVLLLVPLQSRVLRRPLPRLLLGSASCCAVAYLVLRGAALLSAYGTISEVHHPQVHNPLLGADLLTRALNAPVLAGRYLATILVPLHLSADHSFAMVPVGSPSSLGLWTRAAAVLGSLVAVAVILRRRVPLVSFAVVLFLGAVLPFTSVLVRMPSIFRERWAYPAAFALPLALCGLAMAPRLARWRVVILSSIAVLLAAQGVRASFRARDWGVLPLLRMTAEAPRSAWAYYREAEAYREILDRTSDPTKRAGVRAEVGKRIDEALAIWKGYAAPKILAGELDHRAALASGSGARSRALHERAVALFDAAEADQKESIGEIHLYRWRGESLWLLSFWQDPPIEADRAMPLLRRAFQDMDAYLRLQEYLAEPPDYRAFQLRGLMQARLSRLDDAFRDLNVAIGLCQDDAGLWNDRGFCRFLRKDYAGAVRDYEKGLAVARRNGVLYDPSTVSVWTFLERIAAVHAEVAKVERDAGNDEKAMVAESLYQRAKAAAAAVAVQSSGGGGARPETKGTPLPPAVPERR